MSTTATPFKLASCRSCSGRVVWARNLATGKIMPVNPDVDPERGNIVLGLTSDGATATVLSKITATSNRMTTKPFPVYASHFVTCPAANAHRRR